MKDRPKYVAIAVLALFVAIGAVGCGGDDGEDGTEAEGGDGLRVAAVLPGPINDRGYNQGWFEGLQRLEEQGATIAYVERQEDPASALDAATNLSAENDLVLIAGGQFTDIALTAASNQPDTEFVLIDGVPQDPPANLHTYQINYAENGYIAGAVASEATTSGTVGFLGGLEIPPVEISQNGFRQATQDTGGTNVTSTSIGTFNDPSAAREATSAQIGDGADVIFAFVDAAFPGSFEAASSAERDATVIVSNRSEAVCDESPTALGATTVDYPAIVEEIASAFEQDSLPTNEPVVIGVADGVVSMVLCDDHSTPELQQVLESTKREIEDGEISISLG